MTAGRFDPQGTVTSTAFVLAMLYLWGFWPAVLLQAGACVVSETVKKKESWKLFFNVGQYAISLAAAWGVMWLFGVAGRRRRRRSARRPSRSLTTWCGSS